ncbi:hypothetical protein ACLBXO_24810 [Methylobacterium sp. C33D]
MTHWVPSLLYDRLNALADTHIHTRVDYLRADEQQLPEAMSHLRLINYASGYMDIQKIFAKQDASDDFVASGSVIDITWIFLALRSSDATGSRWLGEVIDGVNHLISNEEFRHLDRALETIKVDAASRQILLGLARSTYPVRSRLNYWKTYIIDVHNNFLKRGLEADVLLKGLV